MSLSPVQVPHASAQPQTSERSEASTGGDPSETVCSSLSQLTSSGVEAVRAKERARLGLPSDATLSQISTEHSLREQVDEAIQGLTARRVQWAVLTDGILPRLEVRVDLLKVPFETWKFGARSLSPVNPVLFCSSLVEDFLLKSNYGGRPSVGRILNARFREPVLSSTTSPALKDFLKEIERLNLEVDAQYAGNYLTLEVRVPQRG